MLVSFMLLIGIVSPKNCDFNFGGLLLVSLVDLILFLTYSKIGSLYGQ